MNRSNRLDAQRAAVCALPHQEIPHTARRIIDAGHLLRQIIDAFAEQLCPRPTALTSQAQPKAKRFSIEQQR